LRLLQLRWRLVLRLLLCGVALLALLSRSRALLPLVAVW